MEMNKQTEALKMAIEQIKWAEHLHDWHDGLLDALQACEEALEQPMINGLTEQETNQTMSVKGLSEQPAQEYLTRAQQVIRANNSAQEPVAWMHRHEGEITEFNDFQSCDKCEPLYTHPAPSWQGLSDDEMMEIWFSDEVESTLDFGCAIEQALKEKNHG